MAPPRSKTVLLASPPLACGVAFLGNILLSLDIRIQPPNQPEDGGYWNRLDDGSHEISENGLRHYRTHFHLLNDRTRFQFDPSWTGVMEHRFDMADEPHDAVILFVRDPIDCTYSWYKRYFDQGHTFREYLGRLCSPYVHLPYIMMAPPLLVYAMFAAYWLAGRRKPLKVVRFEDIKQRPAEVVREILHFLGIQRSDAQVQAAVSGSTVDALIKTLPGGKADPKTARRGAVYEWREYFSEEEWNAYTAPEPIASVCRMLGYRTDGEPQSLLNPPDRHFAEYLATVEKHLATCVGRGNFVTEAGPVMATATEAMTQTPFLLPHAVTVGNGLSVDPRLIDGYRAVASALVLLFNGCRYFSHHTTEAGLHFDNTHFNEKFRALASLFYQTQGNADVARMMTGLLAQVSSVREQFEWVRVVSTIPGAEHLLGANALRF